MSDFSSRLLTWWDQHGRKELPWQQNRQAYSVWISEVMLQQTQVTTVIPYFHRFLQRFPSVAALAEAPEDDVLALWEGLGYYSRARNLHKAAKKMMVEFGTTPKDDPELWLSMPGIGKSTANAIVAQVWGRPFPILDGNVKRVLARYHGVRGWPGKREVEQRLWAFSEQHLPKDRVADYTQAIMDLGAAVCKRAKPLCDVCPLEQDCVAYRENSVAELPERAPKKARPKKQQYFAVATTKEGSVLLEKRPPAGIWGGLWSLPEMGGNEVEGRRFLELENLTELPWQGPSNIEHRFTHFDLSLRILRCQSNHKNHAVREGTRRTWFRYGELQNVGVPQPIRVVLDALLAEQNSPS